MTGRLGEKTGVVLHGAAFRIGRRINEPVDARETDRAGAHGAGFERDVQLRADKTLIVVELRSGPQHQDFRVRGRVVEFDDAVAAFRDHFLGAGRDQHRTDGDLAAVRGLPRLFEGQFQIFQILLFHAREDTRKGSIMSKPTEPADSERGERIAKVMARAGVCSRRDAEKLIADGRVALNGQPVKSPALNVDADALITVDGKPIPSAAPTKLWRYHKPAGLVTSHRDPEGRPTVFERLPPNMPRAISVGRLDINSEGLLLLTNDGALARQLELPSQGWVRRYRVRLFGNVTQADLNKLAKGVTIDGVRYGPVTAELERTKTSNAWAMVSLKEGKNREVKRLMEHLGLKVSRLIRVSFGPFHLGHLTEGAVDEIPGKVWREQLGMTKKKPPRSR